MEPAQETQQNLCKSRKPAVPPGSLKTVLWMQCGDQEKAGSFIACACRCRGLSFIIQSHSVTSPTSFINTCFAMKMQFLVRTAEVHWHELHRAQRMKPGYLWPNLMENLTRFWIVQAILEIQMFYRNSNFTPNRDKFRLTSNFTAR